MPDFLNGLDPSAAGSPLQMVSLLRELRAAAGLSIREVSRRAKDRGDWLPTSTLAAVLNRDSLPRAEVVAALVRACGGDEATVDAWTAQCARIAADDVADTARAPRQLPPAPHAFTGRERELRLVDEHTRDATPRAVVIVGPAGIGKTALALHWAHRARNTFPDGQLYVDLRGFSGTDPLDPVPVLHRFLAALGTDAEEIPPDGDERAAMYRSLLGHRRILVVLDNAHSPEQLRDLLPGTGGSAALITARTDLFGLTATHGVPHLRLAPLAREASMDLLGAMIGRGRVATEPEAARSLAAACGDLPLALRLAASQTLARPEQPLGDLRDRIARAPMANLDLPGDEAAGLRSCLDLTHARLGSTEANALNAIGLHPATEFEPAGIAALTATTVDDADAALRRLAAVHLAAPTAEGRWSVHDLVRAYAREQADALPEPEAALRRLYDWHLATVSRTWKILFGVEPEFVPDTAVPEPEFTGPEDILRWLDTRHGALTEMVRHAASGGRHWHAARLGGALWPYQSLRGLHTEALECLETALEADRSLGDRKHRVTVLRRLGDSHGALGHLDESERCLTEARDLAIELDYPRGRCLAVAALGWSHLRRWRLAEARACAAEAAEGFRGLGESGLEVSALDDLAHIDLLIGDHENAASGFERSAKTYTDLDWNQNLGTALTGLARVRLREGDAGTACELLEQAISACRRGGDDHGQALARARLAQARAWHGERADAIALAEQALNATAVAQVVELRVEVLNSTGFAYSSAGDPAAAERLHREAADLAEASADPYGEARARHGLGIALAARGDEAGARTQWNRSLRLHETLGTYERGELASLVA